MKLPLPNTILAFVLFSTAVPLLVLVLIACRASRFPERMSSESEYSEAHSRPQQSCFFLRTCAS